VIAFNRNIYRTNLLVLPPVWQTQGSVGYHPNLGIKDNISTPTNQSVVYIMVLMTAPSRDVFSCPPPCRAEGN